MPLPDVKVDPAQRRARAIRLTLAASAGGKALSIVFTLAQVPIALHYLGSEAYGLWITFIGVTVLLNFVDFGLGVGMQLSMAAAYGRDDLEGVRRAFWTGAAALGAIGLAIVAIGVPVALLGDWADTLKISDPGLRSSAGPALAIVVTACALGVPLNAVARLAAGVQRGWLQAGWIAAGSATTLVAVAAAAWARWNFLGFLAVAALVPVAQGIGLFAHLVRVLGWPAAPAPLLPRDEVRTMLRSSLLYAPPQIGLALIQAAPALAITHSAGPAAVTAFALLIRLFSPVQQGQILLLTPIWPAYTEAHVRGDFGWVRYAFIGSLLATAALALGLLLLASQADTLIRWWVHQPDATPRPALVWATAFWCIVQMAVQPLHYLLVGVGRMRPIAIWGTLGPLAALACMFALGPRFGPVGVAAGGGAGLALVALPGLAAAARRAMQGARSASTS